MTRQSNHRVFNANSLDEKVQAALLMPCVIPSARVVIIAQAERIAELEAANNQLVGQVRTLTVERDAANNQLYYPEGIPLKITAPRRK